MLAHHLVHHLMGGKRDPGVFQLVYFVLMHELFIELDTVYIHIHVYCMSFLCVLVRVQMLFSKKNVLEDGVPLFVGPTWFGSGVSEWLPRINQYDLKGLLSFQVFLLTFFYTLAMLPCSSLVRYDHSTHLSDGNNQARKNHSRPCTRPAAYYPPEFPGRN